MRTANAGVPATNGIRRSLCVRMWPGSLGSRIAVILALAVLAAVLPAPGPGPGLASDDRSVTEVVVLPDDGIDFYIQELDAARSSIDLYVYLLSNQRIVDALIRAERRDVDVRVMLDPVPYGGARTEVDTFRTLDAAGIDTRWSSGDFRFAHVKTLIVDRSVVLVMTHNLTDAAFSTNRGFAVLSTDALLVDHAVAIFDRDWAGMGDVPAGPLVTSPETSRSVLIDLMGDAKLTIDIYAEALTDTEVVSVLLRAVERGVRVRLVMSDQNGLENPEAELLALGGVEVRTVGHLYIHAKMVLVDGERVFLGSQNLTANSLDNNREIGLILDRPSILARARAAFDRDFLLGTRLAPDGALQVSMLRRTNAA
jgi:cardiolipin synthase A/B